MIELYLKTNEVKRLNSISEINYKTEDIFNIRIIDSTEIVLSEIADKFDIDISIFNQKEDIEISSHYLKSLDQISFNFSIPNYNSETDLKCLTMLTLPRQLYRHCQAWHWLYLP